MKIKSLLMSFALFGLAAVFAGPLYAQLGNISNVKCEGDNTSPIRCGYFIEGHQDGANDARSDQKNNYKRYKRKYEKQYESAYREGYDKGFSSVKPFSRWNDRQKDVYDRGHNYGDDDKDRGISRLPARYEGQYDKDYEAYYRRGYLDGYAQKSKQYDVPLNSRGGVITNTVSATNTNRPVRRNPVRRNPRNPIGTNTGNFTWTGRVDNRVNIILQGNTLRAQTLAGNNLGQGRRSGVQTLPRRQSLVSVGKLDGRGTAVVIQQPSRINGYTAIIQIYDGGRGADNYRLQIAWRSSNALEAYSTGRVRWKGRVDHTVNIRISGDSVENVAAAGRNATNVSKSLSGYLARRPGSVRVRRLDGRGTVRVLEQPSRQNDFTAIIQIFDSKRSDDEYELEITW